MRKKWINLIPQNNEDYGGRSTILFRCIHALMTYQLNTLITRTIHRFLAIFQLYQNDNQKLQTKPLITLIVTVIGVYFDHATITNFQMHNDIRDELYTNTQQDNNITPFDDLTSSQGSLENEVN